MLILFSQLTQFCNKVETLNNNPFHTEYQLSGLETVTFKVWI
jgi:hypothetical protein